MKKIKPLYKKGPKEVWDAVDYLELHKVVMSRGEHAILIAKVVMIVFVTVSILLFLIK